MYKDSNMPNKESCCLSSKLVTAKDRIQDLGSVIRYICFVYFNFFVTLIVFFNKLVIVGVAGWVG